MKNKFFVGGIVASLLFSSTPVMAKGNATVEFTGDTNIVVGETFKVYMNISNVDNTNDGVVSIGGNINFDATKLEYVSAKNVESPYLIEINEDANYKIAGLDFTLDNGIFEDTNVYELTFIAKEAGNTVVTIDNVKLTDTEDYMNTTVVAKEINIKEETKEIIEEEKVITTNTNDASVEEKTTIKNDKIIESINDIVTNNTKTIILERVNNYFNELITKIFSIFR